MSRLLPSHTIPSLPPVEPEFVWSCIHRQPSIYLKSFKTYNQKYIIKETLPMGSRKCHEFLSQTSSRSLLNNSSLTGPYVRSCLWVSSKKGQVLQKLRAHWQVHDHHEEFLLHIMAWCLHDSSDFEVNEKKIKMGASPFCRILVLCSSLPFWIKNKSIHHSWRLKQKRSLKIHPISPRLPKKRSHQTPYFVVAIPSILFSRNQVTPLDFHHYNIPKTNVVSLDLRFSRWFPQGFEHGWKIQNQNIGKIWTGNIWSTLFFSVKKCILTNISYIYLQQDSQPNLCTDMSGTLSCDASPKKSEEVTTLGTHHKFMTKVADNIRIFQPGRFSNSNKESTLVGPQQKLPKLWMGIRSWTYYEQFNLHPIWDP